MLAQAMRSTSPTAPTRTKQVCAVGREDVLQLLHQDAKIL